MNEQHFEKWFNKNYVITNNGKIQVLGKTSTYHSSVTIYSKYAQLLEAACMPTDVTLDEIDAYIKANTNVNETKQPAPDDFILQIIENENRYKINSNFTTVSKITDAGSIRDITNEELLNDIFYVNDKTYNFKREILSTAFKYIIGTYKDRSLDRLRANIEYDAACVRTCDEVLNGIYDHLQINEDRDIFITLMKQWMWQVKRFVNCNEVRHHIWLNFVGASGAGKTTLLTKFCKPFEDYYTVTQMDVLLDSSREIKKLTDNFILNFDELAIKSHDSYSDTISKNDMNTIKTIITSDKFETRVMGTQQQTKANRRFSCISSSNSHLYDTCYDETSMRRYFDFMCNLKKVSDFSSINAILSKSSDAWKGINEHDDVGYFNPNNDVGEKVREIQSSYYPTNTTVFRWLNDSKLTEITDETAMYADYKVWCMNEGCSSRGRTSFMDALHHYIKPGKLNKINKIIKI